MFLTAEEEEHVGSRESLSKDLPQFLQEWIDPANGVKWVTNQDEAAQYGLWGIFQSDYREQGE